MTKIKVLENISLFPDNDLDILEANDFTLFVHGSVAKEGTILNIPNHDRALQICASISAWNGKPVAEIVNED